jgi:dipeptidyl aminopeptidase/acylaminoacyl peptidase
MAKFTPEKLVYGIKTATDPQLSPDGEWVVYSVVEVPEKTKKRISQIWLSRRDGSEARQLTFAGKGSGGARWSPDGKSIAFTSDRGDGAALYLLSLAGGDPKQLAAHRNGFGALAFSPDGTKIAYSAVIDPENPEDKEPDPDVPAPIKHTTRADYKQDTRGYLGDKRHQLFVYDLEAGEERRLTNDVADHMDPRWSPDSSTIAVLSPLMSFIHGRLELVDVASGKIRLILSGKGAVGMYAWAKDGAQLLISADFNWDFQQEFHLVSVSTGEPDQITRDLQQTPAGSVLTWIDDRHALFPAASKGRTGFYQIDTETGAVTEEVVGNYTDAGFSTDASNRYVAQVRDTLESVGEVVIYDRETGDTTQITQLNADVLKEFPPAQWERLDVQRGGYTVEAWLLKPANFDPAKKYPLILDIHGGPNGWYGYDFDKLQQMLASNEFIVVFSNPRGSGSYGGDFTRQVKEDWGGEDYLDLMAITDEALKRDYIDPARTGVYGYSYGGYMTSWILGQTDRFKAAVIGAPAVDLEAMFGTSDISHAWGPIQWGGTPWENPEYYRDRSPITHLHKAKTPALILHAEGDVRCPIGQGEQTFATLEKIGLDVEFVRYPGGDHLFVWTGEPTYALDFYARILAWFKKHLGEPV